MALKLRQLDSFLDNLLTKNSHIDFCPNGLQVEGREEIFSIATAVSSSLATIEAAVNLGVQALIVHHGLFWQKDSYSIEGTKRKKIKLLLENGLSLFAYHLPLDSHPHLGNNWKAARDLGWTDLKPFGLLNGVFIGVKGQLAPTSRENLKYTLENYYHHPAICAWGGPPLIETLALVSGGAHKTLLEAAAEGIDAFITGSFDEPTWHQALEEKINFFALGHSATERVAPLALATHLQETLAIPCSFIDIENPF